MIEVWRFLGCAVVAPALAFLSLAACSSSQGGADGGADKKSATPAGSGPAGSPLQSHPLLQDPQVRVDLIELARVGDAFVVAKLRLVNQGRYDIDLGRSLNSSLETAGQPGAPDPNSVSRISLIDPVNSRLYSPLADAHGACICLRTVTESVLVRAGGQYDLEAAFPAPPASVARLGVLFPDSAPFMDVAVGRKNSETVAVGGSGGKVDPARIQLASPHVTPIIATTESADTAEDDTGADLSVRVSSDVLFALNKADLSPAAQRILKGVAAKIDRSSGSTVKIDGYTDNSGNDAINNPLSQHRAQSVEEALKKLVTRSGVGYAAQGHGSADPIAANTSDEGRRLNRRVTVTFAKPRAADPPAGTGTGAPAGQGPTMKILPSAPPGNGSLNWPRNATARIDGLRRYSNGYVVLTWTVQNDDAAPLDASVFRALSSEPYVGSSTSGAVLRVGDLQYRSLRDGGNTNLGPTFESMAPLNALRVEKGEKLTLTAMFKLPAEVRTVTVEIPGFEKADVSVQ